MKTETIQQQAARFLKANHSRAVFAPFPGQDRAAWGAFVCMLELYAIGDALGRSSAVDGMRAAVAAMQETTRWIAKASIAAVLDWGDEEPLWILIENRRVALDPYPVGVTPEELGGERLACSPGNEDHK